MSIANQIAALNADKTDIAAAITAKGGTLSQNAGFDTFATDIANIPFASGSVTFSQFTSTLTVSNLSFTPRKIFIIGADSRLHLHGTKYVVGCLGLNYDNNNQYKLMGQNRTPNNTNAFIWTANYTDYFTIQNGEFTFSHPEYVFAENTTYFWVACG